MGCPTDVRHLDFNITPRIATGVTRFGDDWPGVFFRGDAALHYGNTLGIMLKVEGNGIDPMTRVVLESLANTLMSCLVVHEHEAQ